MWSLEHQIHELIELMKTSTPDILPQINEGLIGRGKSVQDIASAVRNAAEEVIKEGTINPTGAGATNNLNERYVRM